MSSPWPRTASTIKVRLQVAAGGRVEHAMAVVFIFISGSAPGCERSPLFFSVIDGGHTDPCSHSEEYFDMVVIRLPKDGIEDHHGP